jgi:hypothetical protein
MLQKERLDKSKLIFGSCRKEPFVDPAFELRLLKSRKLMNPNLSLQLEKVEQVTNLLKSQPEML